MLIRRLFLATAMLAAGLASACATSHDQGRPDAGSAETPPAEVKMVALPFRLDLTYSSAAQERLQTSGADVALTIAYYGPPKDARKKGLDPVLGVRLGGEDIRVEPGPRSVTVKGRIDAAQVAREVSGDARVRITAIGAGVVCEVFDEYLPIAVETGGMIHCTLAE